jgi:hypothetical protein
MEEAIQHTKNLPDLPKEKILEYVVPSREFISISDLANCNKLIVKVWKALHRYQAPRLAIFVSFTYPFLLIEFIHEDFDSDSLNVIHSQTNNILTTLRIYFGSEFTMICGERGRHSCLFRSRKRLKAHIHLLESLWVWGNIFECSQQTSDGLKITSFTYDGNTIRAITPQEKKTLLSHWES